MTSTDMCWLGELMPDALGSWASWEPMRVVCYEST